MGAENKKDDNIHRGHRQRVKETFAKNGLEPFADHGILELLLFYAVPRGDVNPLAHRLLDHFGKFSNVFDAPIEELKSIGGIGDSAALLIKLIPEINRRYTISRSLSDEDVHILNSGDASRYIPPYFYGETEEVVYMFCLDAKCKVIAARVMSRGETNSANVSVRKIVETALLCRCASVIIAHNHTSGVALPSMDDKITTKQLYNALATVGIVLADHVIVSERDFISMADSGFIKR